MSGWEDFCDSMGLDTHTGFDTLMDRYSRDLKREKDEEYHLFFKTFQDALEWSKNNKGAAFTRSSDGAGFMPSKKKARSRLF